MKILFDLLPIALFFVAFKVWNIYVATGVAIAAVLAQVAWSAFRHKRVDPMLWVSLAIVVVFGGATIVFHNETFIKWKPTVLYWAFAVAMLVSQFVMKKNLIAKAMGSQIKLPAPVWDQLSVAWALFFAALGGVNLLVAFHFSTDVWVNFKLFGTTAAMLAFIVIQSLWLSKYLKEE